jgi:hypothetical protein
MSICGYVHFAHHLILLLVSSIPTDTYLVPSQSKNQDSHPLYFVHHLYDNVYVHIKGPSPTTSNGTANASTHPYLKPASHCRDDTPKPFLPTFVGKVNLCRIHLPLTIPIRMTISYTPFSRCFHRVSDQWLVVAVAYTWSKHPLHVRLQW